MDQADFGRKLRRMRLQNEWSQEQLAERSELSYDTIRRMEAGRFGPSLKTLRKLSEAFGLAIADLVDGKRFLSELARYLAARETK